MRRVVVTGLGIVSSIGNNAAEVIASLKAGKSGIEASPEMAEHGFRSQVAGTLKIDVREHVDKRSLRFMGPGAAYAHIAMSQAIADAGLSEDDVVNVRTGLVAGSGGPSTSAMLTAHQTVLKSGATKRIGPFAVPKCMSSTISANLATAFKIKGINYSITSACSTSLHCIGNAAEQIMMGKQDVMFAGGGEELDWTLSCLFDAMGAMSSKYNDTPDKASRAFDAADPARRPQGQLHQRAWHLHPGGRCRRSGSLPPGLRRRLCAADLLDQIHDRPRPGRRRRAGGDLLPSDAGQ